MESGKRNAQFKADLQYKTEMLGGRWGEKLRNSQGHIWGLIGSTVGWGQGASEAVTLLELPDLNGEVFSLVGQGWVSFGCLVEQGACQGMEQPGNSSGTFPVFCPSTALSGTLEICLSPPGE